MKHNAPGTSHWGGFHRLTRRDVLLWGGLLAAGGGLVKLMGNWTRAKPSQVAAALPLWEPSAQHGQYIALSLHALEEQVRQRLRTGRALDPQLQSFGHITKIHGVVTTESFARQECIVFGESDPALPAILLDDVVVALRATQRFPREPPGVTIDPTEHSPEQFCEAPHTVTFFAGVEQSEFGHVLFTCDYMLKQLAANIIRMSENFQSYRELALGKLKARTAERCQGANDSGTVHNRFWLYPTSPLFERDHGTVVVRKQTGVQLLTEREFVERGKRIRHTGQTDELALSFANSLTRDYDLLATTFAIYERLRTCFRLVTLAKLLAYEGMPFPAYLVHDYPVKRVETPTRVQGIAVDDELSHQWRDGQYVNQCTFGQKLCGGVLIKVDLTPASFEKGPRRYFKGLKPAMIAARPSSTTLAWPFSFQVRV